MVNCGHQLSVDNFSIADLRMFLSSSGEGRFYKSNYTQNRCYSGPAIQIIVDKFRIIAKRRGQLLVVSGSDNRF